MLTSSINKMVACDQSSQNQNHDHVKVKINQETIIKPSTSNLNSNFKAFPLSNFDLLLSGFQVCFVYVYPNPTKAHYNSISRTIKSSLSKTLDHFPPFSGQITTNSSGQTEIQCNHRGVKLLEASVDRSLSDLDMHNQTKSIHQLTKFPKNHRDYILNMQITSFICGGFSISWIFDHLLVDANAFTMFLTAWREIATTGECSTAFSFDRSVLKPRSPPRFDRELVELSYTACDPTDVIIREPQGRVSATERRLYVVRGSNLETLKARSKKTRTVALSAYLWKLMGRAVGKERGSSAKCRMGWAVDGRRRMEGGCRLGNFVGSLVLTNEAECSVGDLEEGSLEWVADVADGAIKKLANGECFTDTMDWVESNRGKVLMHNIVMGLDDKPSIVVSACHDMKVMDVDFGFGLPEFAMISLLDLSFGYVNFVSTGRGDGSWFVSAVLTSSLAEVLDSDPDRVFEPITNIR